MRRLSILSLVLLSVTVASTTMTATASAESSPLPDIHTALPGDPYPIHLIANVVGVASLLLPSPWHVVVQAASLAVLYLASRLTSLGTASLKLLGAEEVAEKHKCDTTGASEANGEVIVPNAEWDLVYTALSPAEQLAVGLLILFTKYVISCDEGLFEIALTGPLMTRINVPTPAAGKGGDSTSLEYASHCEATTEKQEIPYYYNATLERVATTLLANESGLGNKPSCWEVEGTALLEPESSGSALMFSVLL